MEVDLVPRADSRIRRIHWTGGVVVGLAAVLLVPDAAPATCAVEPFDRVVRRSDAVLVATVAAARPAGPHGTGIIVRLDVEDVLKGSEADGARVRMSSCGPFMSEAMVRSWARHEVGQRGLFLLSRYGAVVWKYSEVTKPFGMTLDQQIARARHVLGLPDVASTYSGAARPPGGSGDSPWPLAIGAALAAALGASLIYVRRLRTA
jgi:hypothetical protein